MGKSVQWIWFSVLIIIIVFARFQCIVWLFIQFRHNFFLGPSKYFLPNESTTSSFVKFACGLPICETIFIFRPLFIFHVCINGQIVDFFHTLRLEKIQFRFALDWILLLKRPQTVISHKSHIIIIIIMPAAYPKTTYLMKWNEFTYQQNFWLHHIFVLLFSYADKINNHSPPTSRQFLVWPSVNHTVVFFSNLILSVDDTFSTIL